MAIIDLVGVLPVRHANFWLTNADVGVTGLDGGQIIVSAETRYWEAEVVIPPLTLAQAVEARSIGDQLRGRVNVLRVPVPVPDELVPPGAVNPTAAATTALGNEVGDSQINITGGSGFALVPGLEFEVGDRLYRVEAVAGTVLTINPPLRADLVDGDPLDFIAPAVTMRLADPDGFRVRQAYGRWTEEETTIRLREPV